MPIPDFSNLNSLQFIDPSMYQQGREMVDQAQQASDLQNQQAAQNVQATTLSNLYNSQVNPLLVTHQGLMNDQKTMDNADKQISLNIRGANQDSENEATKQKWLAQASEDDLKQLNAHGEALSIRGAALNDPDMQAKGQRMIAASAKAIAAKAKSDAEQTKTETIVGGRTDVAATNAAARNYAADQALAGRQYSADTQAKIRAIAKDPNQNLQQAYTTALKNGDQEMADALYQTMMNVPMAGQAGRPDLSQYGVPTQGAPAAPRVPAPRAAPSGAGGAGNQVPPITSDVFNQDSGSPATVPQQAAQQATDIAGMQKMLADPNLSVEGRRVIQAQLQATLAKQPQAPKASIVQAPAGRVVIYKDGKAVGSIPQAQVEAAKKQGYTVQ